MANPVNLIWTSPTAYVDGSAFTDADVAGWQVNVDSAPAVAIPAGTKDADGKYTFPLASLSLALGDHTATLATVAKNGQVSVPSNAVSFTLADERVPNPPTGVAAA